MNLVMLVLLLVTVAPDRPNPKTTPGATNPAITQANIHQTICKKGWSTKSIRPTSSYTTALKKQQMTAWGLPGKPGAYEEDHLISLEIGGAPKDPRNLWPEPYKGSWGAKKKDVLENKLHALVCDGTLPLAAAQREISTDWEASWTKWVGK